MVLGLLQPTSGSVLLDGVHNVNTLDRAAAFAFRRRVQPVFQNPYSSLDPMYSVFRAIEEPLRIHRVGDRKQRQQAVRELADQVALPPSVLGRLPRELSGVSANGSRSPGRWRCGPRCWCATRRSRLSTCWCRHRS